MRVRLDTLPVRPAPFIDESAAGYLRRLAVRNGYSCMGDFLSANDYVASASIVWPASGVLEKVVEVLPRRHIHTSAKIETHTLYQYARYCPFCLTAHGYWRTVWEHALAPVCIEHHVKLIGHCHKCEKPLLTSQIGLDTCDCGTSLVKAIEAAPVEAGVIALGRLLLGKPDPETNAVLGLPNELAGLESIELVQLVLFLGAYRQFGKQAKPRKLAFKSNIDIAFALLDGAAQTLMQWPSGISALVKSYLKSEGSVRSVRQRLGYLYIGIHKEFTTPSFEFLRNAFNQYVLSNWPDLIDQKSRWITNVVHDQQFVSGTRVAKNLGVPLRYLREWIATQQLEGTIRHLPSGRAQLALRKGQEQKIAQLSRVFNLTEAAIYMGLPEKRLRELLEAGVIHGRAPVAGAQWRIDPADIEQFMSALYRCAKVSKEETRRYLSLDHILRYRWTQNVQFNELVGGLLSGVVSFVAPEGADKNLNALHIDVDSFNRWSAGGCEDLTVPVLAKRLAIKQEVAYHLINRGIIHAIGTGRSGARVTSAALRQFQDDYCFAREVAKQLRTSPRSAIAQLDGLGISAAASPAIDGCRQYLYRRSDVASLLATAK